MPNSNSTTEFNPSKLSVQELWIYPIKSCAGLQVDRAEIAIDGLKNDRRWQLVEAGSGKFITQRQYPSMARIYPRLQGDNLFVRVDRSREIAIPTTHASVRVTTWDDSIDAFDCGDEIAKACSDFLGAPCRLVEIKSPSSRALKDKYISQKKTLEKLTFGFADTTPLLIVTQASLDALPKSTDPRRFRANIIVAGDLKPYAENDWRELLIGGLSIKFGRYCTRCPIIEVDPDSGVRKVGMIKTVLEQNSIDGKPVFGINCYFDPALSGPQKLKIGDPVVVAGHK